MSGQGQAGTTLAKRLIALSKDQEIPRWCKLAIVGGAFVPTPFELDEVILYPAIMGFLYFRRRHILHRHGFTGAHVVAGMVLLTVIAFAIGVTVQIARHLF